MDRYRGGGESDSYDTRRMPPSPSEVPPNRNPNNNFRPGFSGGGGRSTNFHSPPPHTHGGGGGRSSNFHSPPPANRGGRSNFHSPPPSQGGGGDGVSGFSGGGGRSSNFHSSPPPSNHAHGGGGGGGGFSNGGGFRPMGPAPSSFNGGGMPISGQKRGFPFSPRGGSPPDNTGGGGGAAYAKLFIGSVPATATEEEVRPLFEAHGDVLEVCLLKDKKTGQQSGPLGLKGATLSSYVTSVRFCNDIQGFFAFGYPPFFYVRPVKKNARPRKPTKNLVIWKRDK